MDVAVGAVPYPRLVVQGVRTWNLAVRGAVLSLEVADPLPDVGGVDGLAGVVRVIADDGRAVRPLAVAPVGMLVVDPLLGAVFRHRERDAVVILRDPADGRHGHQ